MYFLADRTMSYERNKTNEQLKMENALISIAKSGEGIKFYSKLINSFENETKSNNEKDFQSVTKNILNIRP